MPSHSSLVDNAAAIALVLSGCTRHRFCRRAQGRIGQTRCKRGLPDPFAPKPADPSQQVFVAGAYTGARPGYTHKDSGPQGAGYYYDGGGGLMMVSGWVRRQALSCLPRQALPMALARATMTMGPALVVVVPWPAVVVVVVVAAAEDAAAAAAVGVVAGAVARRIHMREMGVGTANTYPDVKKQVCVVMGVCVAELIIERRKACVVPRCGVIWWR